jgi:hypothetical protein
MFLALCAFFIAYVATEAKLPTQRRHRGKAFMAAILFFGLDEKNMSFFVLFLSIVEPYEKKRLFFVHCWTR